MKDMEKLTERIDMTKLPRHIAIIMDGNGRWAVKRNLPRIAGHEKGTKTVKRITTFASDIGIKVLSLFAFSTENWTRPASEVSILMRLLAEGIKREYDDLQKNHIRLMVSGDVTKLVSPLPSEIKRTVAATRNNEGLILNLALNYGGRDDIVNASRRLAAEVMEGRENIDRINGKVFEKYLYTHSLPDPDILIRTSGELRISNFFLYQIAYSEIYVTPVLWPDFREKDMADAIVDFQNRERRFGGVQL